MAAGGLTTNVLVFTVAAMLVSPIMGPILGMVMGYRVADFNLFRTGFMNELKMAIVTYLTGCFYGILLGDVSKTYKWPNSQMMHEGMAFNLVISIIVSAAAGMVLGISLTSAGGNALVGTAISAGLLPPLVNAGMLHAYATFYVYDTDRQVRSPPLSSPTSPPSLSHTHTRHSPCSTRSARTACSSTRRT